MSQSYASAGVVDSDLGIWLPWTPTYANITVGAGTEVARYIETVGGLVIAQYMLTFAGDTTMGSNHTISLPVTSDTSFAAAKLNLGPAILDESGSFVRYGFVRRQSSTTCRVQVFNAASTYLRDTAVTAAVPFTWGTGDILSFNIRYERA